MSTQEPFRWSPHSLFERGDRSLWQMSRFATKHFRSCSHDDRVQHEIGFLSLLVWPKMVSKYGVVLRATSSAASPNHGSTAVRYTTSWNRHSWCLLSSVPSKHDGRARCRGSKIVMILRIRVRIVSLLRYHARMRHQHDEHFLRL